MGVVWYSWQSLRKIIRRFCYNPVIFFSPFLCLSLLSRTSGANDWADNGSTLVELSSCKRVELGTSTLLPVSALSARTAREERHPPVIFPCLCLHCPHIRVLLPLLALPGCCFWLADLRDRCAQPRDWKNVSGRRRDDGLDNSNADSDSEIPLLPRLEWPG